MALQGRGFFCDVSCGFTVCITLCYFSSIDLVLSKNFSSIYPKLNALLSGRIGFHWVICKAGAVGISWFLGNMYAEEFN